jgi:hypothetical protein
MSKRTKIIIVIVAVIVISIAAYFIFRKPKAAAETQPALPDPGPGGPRPGGSTTVSAFGESFPLASGMRGENTKRLQIALNRINPSYKISEDGVFGQGTASKIVTTLATSMYTVGPKVTEAQLTNIIRLGNNA